MQDANSFFFSANTNGIKKISVGKGKIIDSRKEII
jgi:hypothetical protein